MHLRRQVSEILELLFKGSKIKAKFRKLTDMFRKSRCENSDLGSLLDLLQIVNPSLQFLF